MELTSKQLKIVDEYCRDNAKKLNSIAYPLLINLGGIYQKDYDDFYSNASWILMQLVQKFDENKGISFEGYLKKCLRKRFKTYAYRDANRCKRKNVIKIVNENGESEYEIIPDTSLDAPIEDGSCILQDMLISNSNIEDILFNENTTSKYDEYMSALPKKARKVVELLGQLYKPNEIKEILHITEKEYSEAMFSIKSSEYISILY